MLWTDGIFISIDDLYRMDSEIKVLTKNEGIVVDGDYGTLRGGLEEASQELTKMIVAYGGYLSSGDLSPNHMSAVLNIGLGNSVRQRALLSQVVVSGTSAFVGNHIKNWAATYCLMYIYRDATNRTVKDRYESKMLNYKSHLDRRLTRSIQGLGLPLIIQPLSRPAALFERNTGSWGEDNVLSIAGGSTTGGSFDVAITYVCQGPPAPGGGYNVDATKYVSYSQQGNAESHPSTVVSKTVPANEVLKIDITSLNPPTGVQDPSSRLLCVILPLNATGWNVYVGATGGTLKLQNATPIPIATKTYTLASDPTTTGIPVGIGQYADRYMAVTPNRQRS